MKKTFLAGIVGACILLAATSAAASYQLNWSDASGDFGSIFLTLNSDNTISSVGGNVKDAYGGSLPGGMRSITSLSSFASADNKVVGLTGSPFDASGLSFVTDPIPGEGAGGPGLTYNFSTHNGVLQLCENHLGCPTGEAMGRENVTFFTFANTHDGFGDGNFAVPEPATWAMMLLGFGAIGATIRRRRHQLSFA